MARQRERRVYADGATCSFARKLDEPLLHSPLQITERAGVSGRSEALLRYVAQEVADIESRIAHAVQVEVEQDQPSPADEHLIRVEIPVDTASSRLRDGPTEPVARREQTLDA